MTLHGREVRRRSDTVTMMLCTSGATETPRPVERTFVVVLSPVDLSADLGLTVLWRSDVQRVMVSTFEAAVEVARVRPATMFVVGGLDPEDAAELLRRLRGNFATRQSALAVLCPVSALDQEEALRAAGANVVLPTPVDPEVWDGRLRPRRNPSVDQETSGWEAELRAISARESAILESVLDSILVLDQEGRIQEFNRAAEEAYGYTKAEVIGRMAEDTIVPPRLRETHRLGFLRRRTGGDDLGLNQRTETVALRADGREFPVELAVTAALDRGVKVYTVYLRDISERRRAEREAAAEHATLRILSDAASLAEAAAPLLETLCTAHGWDMGTIWMRDDDVGAVKCVSLWKAEGVEAPELEALAGDVFFPLGTGLVGHVSATAETLWVEDLARDGS